MAHTTLCVRDTVLIYQDSGKTHALLVESPEWYQWLETASTFAFESSQASFTARKERSGNKRGGWYWKAYRRRGGKLYRAYLGQSTALTLSHLHAVAAQLAAQDEESPVKSLPALQEEAHFSYAQVPREELFLVDQPTGESSADLNPTVKVLPRQRLSAERIRRHWSQLEVADQLGTTPGNVSRWERGITSPGPYFRSKLCELFGSSAQELGLTWGESDDSPGHTQARLEHVAGILSAQSEDKALLPASLAADTDGELETVQPPLLAQRDTPIHPLLATKLHMPHPRPHLVPRAHLVERLQQGMDRALTLVSAPAGFGKTTVLAQWLAQSDLPVAWLSLEAEDNDPTRFLFYLIAVLQTLDPQIGTTALALLRTPQPPSPETVLAVLTNDLVDHGGGDFALVLDDYHVLSAESIQRGMTSLLEHLPPQMHLVLATRADPPLPSARLRAQGQLCEIRTADLRFGIAEAGTFLQTVMGLDLETSAIATLEQRTEGWIAVLQLAALSLQGRADISGFLAAFSGTHRYVLDYLSDEVLVRQPAAVQQFLLHTCILERLSGPLCDAVTEQEGSQAMLEGLERANLFVAALDDVRDWYRYHHLFAEVLRRHLQQAEPMLVPVLHRRASTWYEQHELPIEAVQHALDALDVELAARLIEPIALPIALHGQLSTVLGWLHALPEALVRSHPFLCVSYALLLTVTNQLEAAEARLQEAERSVQEEMPAEQAQIIMGYVLAIRGTSPCSLAILHRGSP